MQKLVAFSLLIFMLIFISGCSSGPSEAEIESTVEAKIAISTTQTAIASLPTLATPPIPTPTQLNTGEVISNIEAEKGTPESTLVQVGPTSVANVSISLEPFNYTLTDDGGGWNSGRVELAIANKTDELIWFEELEEERPPHIVMENIVVETQEGATYSAQLNNSRSDQSALYFGNPLLPGLRYHSSYFLHWRSATTTVPTRIVFPEHPELSFDLPTQQRGMLSFPFISKPVPYQSFASLEGVLVPGRLPNIQANFTGKCSTTVDNGYVHYWLEFDVKNTDPFNEIEGEVQVPYVIYYDDGSYFQHNRAYARFRGDQNGVRTIDRSFIIAGPDQSAVGQLDFGGYKFENEIGTAYIALYLPEKGYTLFDVSECLIQSEGFEDSEAEEPASIAMECTDAIGCVEIASDDPIVLAIALSFSGPNSEMGLDSQHGIELAIDFRGEILGHLVELQPEDNDCSANGAQTSAENIVSNPTIIAVVGTGCPGTGTPMAKILTEAGLVMVSPSDTDPYMTNSELHEAGYLRTAPTPKVQGRAMAEFAYNELGVRKAAAIHEGDPYTSGFAFDFSEAFKEMGGSIVAFEAEAADATNVEPLLTSIAAADPEFIYYPVFIPLGSLITKTSAKIHGLESVILAASDSLQFPSFLENTVGTSEGMYTSELDLSFSNTFYDEIFLPAYQEKYGSEPTALFHAYAFDATNMILDAVEAVAQQAIDGTLIIGRQALRDALFATHGMEGITGTITCDDYGDCGNPKGIIIQVQDSKFVPIWP